VALDLFEDVPELVMFLRTLGFAVRVLAAHHNPDICAMIDADVCLGPFFRARSRRLDHALSTLLCLCSNAGFASFFFPDCGDIISLVRFILREQALRVSFLRLMPFCPDASVLYALDRTIFESAGAVSLALRLFRWFDCV
jgi:hypothetical protein